MKIFVLILMSVCFFAFPVMAQDYVNYVNYGNEPVKPVNQDISLDADAEDDYDDTQDTDDFYNELIQQQYGSNYSPDFEGRSNMYENTNNYDFNSQ